MVGFVNECLLIYKKFVEFFFSYAVGGVPLGYYFLASVVFCIIIRYVAGVVK